MDSITFRIKSRFLVMGLKVIHNPGPFTLPLPQEHPQLCPQLTNCSLVHNGFFYASMSLFKWSLYQHGLLLILT